MKKTTLRHSAIILSAALLPLALSACGSKNASDSPPTVNAGKTVAPPAGKQWSNIVSVTSNGGYLMGNPGATIKIAEYGSFTCPHCRDFASESKDEIAKMVDTGKMSFEYRPYVRDPLDMTVALLAECGGPEPFFPLSHQLFDNQVAMYEAVQGAGDKAYGAALQEPVDKRFVTLAKMAGLIDFVKQRGISEDKATQCLANQKQAETLAAQVQDANTTFDVTGTPTLIMNGSVVENVATWDLMKAKLKEAGL